MKIYKLFGCVAMAVIALSVGFGSCSKDDFADGPASSQSVNLGGLSLQIGDYPVEGELRSGVPGFTVGKTNWEKGDMVHALITYTDISSNSSNTEKVALQFDGQKWDQVDKTFTSSLSNTRVTVSALYIGNDQMYFDRTADGKHFAPKLDGTCEYFLFNVDNATTANVITIDFKRNYSRLRVYIPNSQSAVKVTLDAQMVANGVTPVSSIVTETVNGVAYFYGTWAAGTVMNINGRDYTFTDASIDGKSYAIAWQKENQDISLDGYPINLDSFRCEIADEMLSNAFVESEGLYRINVYGDCSDDELLVDMIDCLNEVLDERNEAEGTDYYMLLNLTNLEKMGVFDTDRKFEWYNALALALPRNLAYATYRTLSLDNIVDLFVYNVDMRFESNKRKPTFQSTADCVLHLPVGTEVPVGEVKWFDATWKAIVADAK